MSASKRSKRQAAGWVSRERKEHCWIGLLATMIALANCMPDLANATDLPSSQTGYVLSPADNPFTVAPNTLIDATAHVAIYGEPNDAITWTLTNNGVVISPYFAVEFDSPAAILNNGSMRSNTTTGVALYNGGDVVNSAGAFIVGHRDAIYANGSASIVTNAGTIGGSAEDVTTVQSGVHLPAGGTVVNLATGTIVGYGPGILSNAATRVLNDGVIISLSGTAIDLSAGSGGSFVSNSGGITGSGGTAILFGPGDDTLLLTGTSSIVGVIDAGTGSNTLILGGTKDGSFDISRLGSSAQYRGFDTLRKDDSGAWTLAGANSGTQNWLIGGGGISVAGQLSGSVLAQPGVTGVDIEVLPGGSVHASSGNAVLVNDASRVVNRGSIASSADGVAAVLATGSATSVENAGFIASQGANGIGVAIDAPTGSASLTNELGASITSAAGNAVQAGSNVSIINAGMIAGSSVNGTGVAISAAAGSASLTNKLGGSISGANGISVSTGSNVSISNAGAIAASGATGTGVAIDAPAGFVGLINQRGASIKGGNGVSARSGSNVSIENAGVIAAQGMNGTAVSIDAPNGVASLTNEQGASINSAAGVAVLGGSNVSIVNVGTISGQAAALRFTGSNNRLTLASGSDVSGDIDGGMGSSNALMLQGAGTLSSRTSGFSTLAVQDADWTVSGPVSIASDSTIRNSTLTLTGSLSSPAITVASDATLNGTGTLKGALAMQGVIAPGVPSTLATTGPQPLATGTLSVAGSYMQASGSRYEADITPQGNDLIAVDGTATLQGGLVLVRLRAASFSPTDTYTILSTTAGLTGVFSGMTTVNPFVSASLTYDANNAYLHVQRGFQFAGGTPNQIAVEAALDHGVAQIGAGVSPTRDFLGVAGDLLSLEGSSAYAALDQLSAEAYAAIPNAHFEAARLGMNAIDNRLGAARVAGECAADEAGASPVNAERVCSWISVLGSTGRLGGYDTWLGQQTSVGGVISGIDYRIAQKVTIGAALAAMHGNTSTSTLPVHGQFDTYQAAFYGSYAPGLYWLQALAGYARNSDDMKRSVFFTDTPRTALGSVDGNQYFATLSNGVDVSMGKIGVVSPFVSLEMQRVQTPAFNESGADSVNLAVSANTANSMRSLLGARWRNGFGLLGHAWSVNGELAWIHQYGARTQAVSASFEGATDSGFTVHGSGPARDAMQAGVGVHVALGQRMHAGLRYDGEFGGGGHTHAASVGFDYRW
ncbi:autotransporter domain-containing protein [Caballeronia sp. DA-9]|uniref:autotransporter domain-containing protein n=1 Tax=Caballeronia sp. DA-9 TaxID=3436237 RepID=UPI003F6634F3